MFSDSKLLLSAILRRKVIHEYTGKRWELHVGGSVYFAAADEDDGMPVLHGALRRALAQAVKEPYPVVEREASL